jgi:hypothetical protein
MFIYKLRGGDAPDKFTLKAIYKTQNSLRKR